MLVIHSRPVSSLKKDATSFLLNQLENRSVPILFLSSGGSSLTLLEEEISLPQTDHLTVGMIDERVTDDSTINNYAQALGQPLMSSILARGGASLSSLPGKNQSLDSFASEYETRLAEWLSKHPNSKIIATLGIGQDGHIAAIFPEPAAQFKKHYLETDRLIHSHESHNLPVYPKRITVTGRLLQKINCAIVFVAGENKKSIVQKILEQTKINPDFPGTIIHTMPQVHFFTDVF